MSRRERIHIASRSLALLAVVFLSSRAASTRAADAKEETTSESQLAEVQGRWEREEPQGSDASYKRATKEINGTKETVTYFDADGKVVRQHKVDFKLSRAGDVNIFTYTNWEATEGPQKGTKMPGPVSYIYRVSEKQYREAWGLLPGQENRRSLLLIWKKAEGERGGAALASATDKAAAGVTAAALNGTWKPTASERGGEPQNRDEMERHALKFDGDKFTIFRDGDAFLTGTYKVGASEQPAEIDMTIENNADNSDDNGKVVRGILELSGDELKWCTGGPRTEQRPTEFKTAEGSRVMLITFKREKPAGKVEKDTK
jgi:uncharacterized protein (TIGR03067 family)